MFDLATKQNKPSTSISKKKNWRKVENRTNRDRRRELGMVTRETNDESYDDCERLDSWAGGEIESEWASLWVSELRTAERGTGGEQRQRQGEWVSESGETKLKRLSVRQRDFWVVAKEKWGIRVDYRYIYKGYFCNFRVSGFYQGQVSGRVSDFFIKPRPTLGFFFKTHTRPYS